MPNRTPDKDKEWSEFLGCIGGVYIGFLVLCAIVLFGIVVVTRGC